LTTFLVMTSARRQRQNDRDIDAGPGAGPGADRVVTT
jgi:hypothetical protein